MVSQWDVLPFTNKQTVLRLGQHHHAGDLHVCLTMMEPWIALPTEAIVLLSLSVNDCSPQTALHNLYWLCCRYLNGGKDADKYQAAQALGSPAWVELNGSWHEIKFHHLHLHNVDWVFVDHVCFHRPGTPYGSSHGSFPDNLFRFALLSLAALEAPLNLPIGRLR